MSTNVVGEFVGTGVLLLSVLLLPGKLLISIGFLLAITVAGLLGSPSHINPAVSAAMVYKGDLPIADMIPMVIAQLVGAGAAIGVVRAFPALNVAITQRLEKQVPDYLRF